MTPQPASDPDEFTPVDELQIDNIEVLKAVFDPLRMRILEAFAGSPRTVKQVSEELGTTPHRLYYHVNILEEYGLLAVTETRMVSGIVEKHYQLAARHILIAPRLLSFGSSEREEGLNILLQSVLEQTRLDVLRSARRQIIDLARKSPDPAALLMRRGFARMSTDQAAEFHHKLRALLDEFTTIGGEDHAADDQTYAFSLAFYPTIPFDESQAIDDL